MHRIETTYTEDDMVNLSCFVTFRLDTFRKSVRNRQIFLALMTIVLFGLSVWQFHVSSKWGGGEFFWLLTLVMLIVTLRFPRRFRNSVSKVHRKTIREIADDLIGTSLVVELREDGVFTQNVRGQSTYVYSTVGEIVENAGCVYVFVSKGSALIFPRDRIPRETLDAFIAELKTRVNQSQKAQAV